MFDLPLHPIIVHFPIALGCLMPVLMIFSIITIQRYRWPVKTWWMIVFLQALLLISAIAAVNSGEYDEESGRAPLVAGLDTHEEWGEKVPVAAGVMFILTLTPLFISSRSKPLMIICTIASLGIVLLLIQTGHTGGQLIYSRSKTSGTSLQHEHI